MLLYFWLPKRKATFKMPVQATKIIFPFETPCEVHEISVAYSCKQVAADAAIRPQRARTVNRAQIAQK
jgi:hypothetical protein